MDQLNIRAKCAKRLSEQRGHAAYQSKRNKVAIRVKEINWLTVQKRLTAYQGKGNSHSYRGK